MRVLRVSHSSVVDAWRARERELRALGHEVEVLSARTWDEAGRPVMLVPREGEPVEAVRTWGRHPAVFLYDPRPLWRALGQTWDVIDIHEEPFALSTAEVLLLRWLRGQHAPYLLYSAQNLPKRYPLPFRLLESWSLRHAAAASVCNVDAARRLHSRGLPVEASVIPLGTDLDHFRPGDRTRDRDGLVTVGYAGRLEAHKGVSVLLDAISGDSRLRLVVAGAGPESGRLESYAARLGLDDRISWLGPLEQGDLPDFYRGVDVVALPSLTTPGWVEQFGRVAVEAMACGTPVVASDSGALPDVVEGAGELVPPGDPDALREALLAVGLDPERAERMREAGLAKAATTSWQEVGAAYAGLYERVTQGPDITLVPDGDDLPPVEVIVVAYGAPELLRDCLAPLRREHVTVVDNSSSPQVKQVCDELEVIYRDPGRNLGFAAGVNEGLRHRRFDNSDILLLNPDAVVQPGGIRLLQRHLRADPRLAAVAPAQTDEDGRRARVSWPFPSPLGAWMDAAGVGRLFHRRAGFVIGSVLLLRAEALAQVGALDERFFLYAEETDWAYRASRLGWRSAEVSEVTAIHVGAGTAGDPARREAHFHASQERYFRKHFGTPGWHAARAAQLVGAAGRSMLPGDRGRSARERFGLYARGPVTVERRHLETAGNQG